MTGKLTPTQAKFLAAARENGGEVVFYSCSDFGRADHWMAGTASLSYARGRNLVVRGLIERVLQPGTRSTERLSRTRYRYRLTEAGQKAP